MFCLQSRRWDRFYEFSLISLNSLRKSQPHDVVVGCKAVMRGLESRDRQFFYFLTDAPSIFLAQTNVFLQKIFSTTIHFLKRFFDVKVVSNIISQCLIFYISAKENRFPSPKSDNLGYFYVPED